MSCVLAEPVHSCAAHQISVLWRSAEELHSQCIELREVINCCCFKPLSFAVVGL